MYSVHACSTAEPTEVVFVCNQKAIRMKFNAWCLGVNNFDYATQAVLIVISRCSDGFL